MASVPTKYWSTFNTEVSGLSDLLFGFYLLDLDLKHATNHPNGITIY